MARRRKEGRRPSDLEAAIMNGVSEVQTEAQMFRNQESRFLDLLAWSVGVFAEALVPIKATEVAIHLTVFASSHDSSDEDDVTAVSDKENLDDMTFTRLKEVCRRTAPLSWKKNEAEKRARRALGDITNNDNSGNAAKRRKKAKKHAKRRRLEAQSDDDTDPRDTSDSSESEEDDTDRAKKVASFGRHCVIERALWIESDTFETAIDATYDEKTGRGMRAGWFKHAFRCNTSTRIRRTAGSAIYNCSPADLLTPAARREFREEIGWSGKEYTSFDVPILQRVWSADGLSGASTNALEQQGKESIADNCRPSGGRGKSEDADLKKRGVTTNIDYAARFEEHLEILTTGLRTKSGIESSSEASAVDPASRAGKIDGFKRAMEAMRAEEPVDQPQDAEDK
ncbi:hypothetical protein C8R47DRAFT_1071622 [Mycena vitilis]|nr:hypothetical protein C8R47DRAFT_1071622 [Mycena vitilis]